MLKQFMIGQYGGFDDKKFKRDFKLGFHGIEACLMGHEEDVECLQDAANREGFHFGVHFPLRSGYAKLRDALFLSPNDTEREQAYRYIQQELDYMTSVNPDYVLFHYPKPVILDDRVDWSLWRFTDETEYVYESKYSFAEFSEKSELLFAWLSDKSEEYRFTPVLEFDGLNKYIYETDFLECLLDRYPRIRLCLDTARLHLQDETDPHFDAKLVIHKFTKYAHIIHLSNAQVAADGIQNRHYPVLPELRPEEGWAPIAEYLRIVRQENRNVKILFEHRSDRISDEQLERCYAWVDELLNS
ncbi:sugar phosphate isomerase/epimerase [Paenibacillus profundus]|uniref:Sugar phosphate isomerase/epimerase n=1 Tax=Paenibacillus profundus TaxID=1173085 RepID=A0ABS8YHX6_9BACL|nr:TIM barrel protein [Paenibacillus profundus]MCE5170834.1 sugar phosphate isomerase/epimerase [Paenibacillus profundus]